MGSIPQSPLLVRTQILFAHQQHPLPPPFLAIPARQDHQLDVLATFSFLTRSDGKAFSSRRQKHSLHRDSFATLLSVGCPTIVCCNKKTNSLPAAI